MPLSTGFDDQLGEVDLVARQAGNLVQSNYSHDAAFTAGLDVWQPRKRGAACLVLLHSVFPFLKGSGTRPAIGEKGISGASE